MMLLARNIDTDVALNKTVHPVSTIGASPPSECVNPGTMWAGTVSCGAIVAVPDEVANNLLPSGCIIGDDSVGVSVLCVIRWLSLLVNSKCVQPLSTINVVLLVLGLSFVWLML